MPSKAFIFGNYSVVTCEVTSSLTTGCPEGANDQIRYGDWWRATNRLLQQSVSSCYRNHSLVIFRNSNVMMVRSKNRCHKNNPREIKKRRQKKKQMRNDHSCTVSVQPTSSAEFANAYQGPSGLRISRRNPSKNRKRGWKGEKLRGKTFIWLLQLKGIFELPWQMNKVAAKEIILRRSKFKWKLREKVAIPLIEWFLIWAA